MDKFGKELTRVAVAALVAYVVAAVLRELGAGKLATTAASGALGSLAASYAI